MGFEWFGSPFIIAPLASWLIAQILKHALNPRLIKDKRAYYSPLVISGGMPSAHSAAVVSLLTVVGIVEGLNSAIFGVALLFAAVVLYDSVVARRSIGEQGEALTYLLNNDKKRLPPKIARGHRPAEIAAGAAIGLIVGVVVIFTLQSVDLWF